MIRISPLATIIREPSARLTTGLLLAFVLLLPVEPLYNAPWMVLAVLGAAHLAVRGARLGLPEIRLPIIVFLCVWLPMLASLPDAVNPAESIRKTASLCIYFLASVYAAGAYIRFRDLDWTMTGVTAICLFWSFDALWQFFTGADWFGIHFQEGDRLPGIFHSGRIGNVLASFAPLVFEVVRRAMRRWWWCPVLLAPFLMTIFLSGTRTAWGALVVAAIGYLLFLIRWSDRPTLGRPRWNPGRLLVIPVAVVLAAALTAYAWPAGLERVWKTAAPRVETLAGLWSGDRAKFERAVTYRLSIWETAANMWSRNWLNGVGPRGFRYAYSEYSPDRDYFLENHEDFDAPLSPHMLLLEIVTETGAFGLLGYVVLVTVLLARLSRLKGVCFRSAYPYVLTLIVALFPFSGHLSFYSVLSTALIWWMVTVTASAFAAVSRKGVEDDRRIVDA